MNINLNLYKYFYSVAKNLSYTKAAEELMVSQPSISYNVKVLEEQLNKKLFERSVKGIELTNDGNNLFEKIKPMMHILNEIENNNEIVENITIGIRPMYSENFFPTRVSLLKKIFPNISINCKIGDSSDLYEYLKNNIVDFIIDDKEYNEFHKAIIKTIPIKLCFIGNANSNRSINSIDDLKNDKIILVKSNIFSQKLVEMYPNLNYVGALNTPIMINLVENDNAIGYTFDKLIENYLNSNRVKIINCNIPLPSQNDLYIYYNNSNYLIKNIIDIFSKYDLFDSLKNLTEK